MGTHAALRTVVMSADNARPCPAPRKPHLTQCWNIAELRREGAAACEADVL